MLSERIAAWERIKAAEKALNRAVWQYLELAGWHFSVMAPDSVWGWKKTVDGTRYFLPEDRAISMQRALDLEAEAMDAPATEAAADGGAP